MSRRFAATASVVFALVLPRPISVAAQTTSPPPTLAALRAQATELKKGDQRKRLDVLKQLIKQEPNEPMWQVQLGDTCFELYWFDDAVDAYVDFAKRFPTHPLYRDVCFAIVNNLKLAGRAKEADKFLLTLPKDDPEWIIRVGVWRANLVWSDIPPETGDPVLTARTMLTDLIAKYPAEPRIWDAKDLLARSYTLTAAQYSNPARAREEYQALIRDYPGHAWTNGWKESIAGSYEYEKNYDAAIRQWRSIADDPAAADCRACSLCAIARCYLTVGHRSEAIQLWNDVVTQHPDSPWAKTAKEYLGRESGDPQWETDPYPFTGSGYSDSAIGFKCELSGPSLWPVAGELTKLVLQQNNKPVIGAKVSATVKRLKPSTEPNTSMEETKDAWEFTFGRSGDGVYAADFNRLGPGKYNVHLRITVGGKGIKPAPPIMYWEISAARCPRISVAELKRLSQQESVVLVDVRDHPEEYIKGALLIPAPKIAEYKDKWPAGKTIAIYGQANIGPDDAEIMRILASHGAKAAVLLGGFDARKAAGWETATD